MTLFRSTADTAVVVLMVVTAAAVVVAIWRPPATGRSVGWPQPATAAARHRRTPVHTEPRRVCRPEIRSHTRARRRHRKGGPVAGWSPAGGV